MWLNLLRTFTLSLCVFTLSAQSLDADTDHETYLLSFYNDGQYQNVIEKVDSILSTNPEKNISRLYQIKADALYFLNDVEQSLENYLITVDTLDTYPLDTVYLIESYSHTGFCLVYLGRYIEAIPYYEKALYITEAANDSLEIANQLAHLGTLHSDLGNYKKAIEYLNRAYHIDLSLKDTIALAHDLSYLGDLKCKTSDYQTAINYYKQALKVRKGKAGNHNSHILRLGKLSKAYLDFGKIDSARKYNKQARIAALDINDRLSLAKQWIVQTQILNARNQFDSALIVGNLCYTYFNGDSENKYQVTSAYAMVEAYIGKLQYLKADELLNRVLEIANRNNLMEDLSLAYKKKAELQEKMGHLESALSSYKNYQMIEDTLQQREKQRAVLMLDQEYQTSQKEQQIALLEAKDQVSQLQLNERNRNMMLLLSLFLIFILASIYIYYSNRKKHQLQNQLLASQVNELRTHIKSILEGDTSGLSLESESLNEKLNTPLSEREFEILEHAIGDLSNVQIAEKIFVSVNTVKYHLKNIYEKLGVSNRKQALEYVIKSK